MPCFFPFPWAGVVTCFNHCARVLEFDPGDRCAWEVVSVREWCEDRLELVSQRSLMFKEDVLLAGEARAFMQRGQDVCLSGNQQGFFV